jgi:hypothetical protein
VRGNSNAAGTLPWQARQRTITDGDHRSHDDGAARACPIASSRREQTKAAPQLQMRLRMLSAQTIFHSQPEEETANIKNERSVL